MSIHLDIVGQAYQNILLYKTGKIIDMTLCVAWIKKIKQHNQLVIATDSLITGGYRYPHGTKLMTFGRNDCALCWEGDTSFTYSFAENAKTDVELSDHLCTGETPLVAVVRRITKVFNQLWQANLVDKGSAFHDARLSFFFGGYCPVFQKPVLWHIRQQGDDGSFKPCYRELRQPLFTGSGRYIAREIYRSNPGLTPYQVLAQVIEDGNVQDVGGVPQLVTVNHNGLEIIGIIKDRERYLFGRNLGSTGHSAKIRYVQYKNNEF